MKRKDYEKPTTQVVKLQHQCHILVGSGTQVENYQEWENVDI